MLSVDHLTGGYGRTIVLRDVSISVPPGGVVAIVGPNGAGKTTLLRMIAGLLRPDSGAITFDGRDITRDRADARVRAGVCLIPEGHGIFPSLTVQENLRLHAPPGEERQGLEVALHAFPALRDRLRQKAGTLSGGQQQMLALSRAYTRHPRLVLVDEASLGLAPILVDEIFESLRVLATTGTSLVIVEQFVGRALALAQTVYAMNRGTVVLEAASADVDPDRLGEQYFGITAETDRGDVQPSR
jgi:branched-chain amino acid transport system ATP-binding protein